MALGSLRLDEDQDEGSGVQGPQFKPDEDDDEEGDAEDKPGESDADVRDVRYLFECKLSEANRGLMVKPLTVAFSPESLYGNRLGNHSGLMVTARAKNQFHKSKLWRTATCPGVQMLFGAWRFQITFNAMCQDALEL